MDSNDEKSVISEDADTINGGIRGEGNNVASGLNSKHSTSFKIDKIWIDLGIIDEREFFQKCRHFSIRGYVAEMREKGRSNLLPFTEKLPPIDVPNFRQWNCQRCLHNCETENTSQETAFPSACNPSTVKPSAKSNSQQDRNRVKIRPFGEGPSGVKHVKDGNNDQRILAALGADEDQSLQEIPAKAAIPQEPITEFRSVDDCNVAIEATPRVSGENPSNGMREHENLEKAIVVEKTITTLEDPNDCSNEPPKRKARKVRLLKELLSENTENPQQKTENAPLRLGPRSSSPPSEPCPQIKRKIPHDHDHDQRSVNITVQGHFGKKAKSAKVNAVPKTNVVEHRNQNQNQNQDRDQYQRFVDITAQGYFGKKAKSSEVNPVPKTNVVEHRNQNQEDQDQRSVDITAQGYFGKKAKSSKVNPVPKTNMVEHRNQNQDHVQDQRSVDIIAQGYFGKKAKSSKVNAVPKTDVVEHRRDPEARESGDNANKYQCHKHGTQRSPVLDHNIGTDRMTAWRSIFNDMERLDDQITSADGVSRPTHDISKDRGTEPDSNLPSPPPPHKTRAKKTSKNPHKSKLFEEGSRKENVGCCKPKDSGQPDTELALGLSLDPDPKPDVRPRPLNPNRNPGQDHGRKPGFFLGESSISRRNSSDLKSKERCVHDVGNRYAPGSVILQDRRDYTQISYGSCCGHQKSDFPDPYKRNTGVRFYSDVTMPHNHERRENTFPIGRSDEREIVELMAKNQYERSLYYPPVRSNNNRITPDPSGFPNVITKTPSFHPEYLSMIRPSSSSIPPISMSAGPTATRNPGPGFFPRDRVSNFPMFDPFSQSKKIPDKNVLEAFSPYRNGPTFGQEYGKRSNNDKGKNVIDLDLNVVAPIVIEDQTDSDSYSDSDPLDFTSGEYRNEAIPAMQLLSLMDAGKSTYPFPDPKKLANRSLTMAGKSNYCCPCSGPRSGVSNPVSRSTHFRSDDGGFSFGNGDRNERVSLAIVPRFDPPVCTLNRNPADFSSPGPKNEYMIDYEDLKFRWEGGSYKRKSGSENPNRPKRQKWP